MDNFFIHNNKEMSNEKLLMRKTALTTMPSGPVPCTASTGKKRVEIYDPSDGVKRKLEPYSANAKELYRFYIRELGFDETWIAPLDLDYQKSSGRFMKREKPKEKPMITERSAYKGYLRCFKLHNYQKVMGLAGFDLIQQFRPQLMKALEEHGALKVYPSAYCLFEKVLEGVAYQSDIEFPLSLAPVQVLNAAQLDGTLKQMVSAMKEKIPELELRGTGMKLQRVSTLELQMARFKPLKGSSFFPLPEALAAKKAIVNVQNKDQECFKWAVLSALFPAPHKAERVSKYKEHQEKLDWSGLSFPVQLDKIKLFETRNEISVNVYGCDVKKKLGDSSASEWMLSKEGTKEQKQAILERRRSEATYRCSPYPLRLSKLTETAKHIDLLLLENEEGQSHYCWIKNFSRFAAQNSNRNTAHYCRHCLYGFPSQQKLDDHIQNGCREITEARPVDGVDVDGLAACSRRWVGERHIDPAAAAVPRAAARDPPENWRHANPLGRPLRRVMARRGPQHGLRERGRAFWGGPVGGLDTAGAARARPDGRPGSSRPGRPGPSSAGRGVRPGCQRRTRHPHRRSQQQRAVSRRADAAPVAAARQWGSNRLRCGACHDRGLARCTAARGVLGRVLVRF